METEAKNDEITSVTSLVSGIVRDAQMLIGQQLELFRHELRADLQNLKTALVVLTFGAGVGLLGAILLGFALVFVLQASAPTLPLWACYAICGGAFAVLSSCLLGAGFAKLRAENALPEQSVEALKENFQWKTNPK